MDGLMNDPFIPKWAASSLGEKVAPEAAAALTTAERTELLMLREFFSFWSQLHALPRTKENRRKQEEAAQNMVDAAATLRRFREGGPNA
jgi:hypothetical protein